MNSDVNVYSASRSVSRNQISAAGRAPEGFLSVKGQGVLLLRLQTDWLLNLCLN